MGQGRMYANKRQNCKSAQHGQFVWHLLLYIIRQERKVGIPHALARVGIADFEPGHYEHKMGQKPPPRPCVLQEILFMNVEKFQNLQQNFC